MMVGFIPERMKNEQDWNDQTLDQIAHLCWMACMMRYLNSGERHYGESPVMAYPRGAVEFQVVLSGGARPWVVGEDLPRVRAPAMWVHPGDSRHGWTDHRGGVSRVLVFHFYEVNPVLSRQLRERGRLVRRLNAEEVTAVEGMMALLKPHMRQPRVLSPLWMDKVCAQLSLLALKGVVPARARSSESIAEQKVRQATAWYRERLSQAPTVAQVARGVSVSPAHLRRLFLQATGESPQQVLRELRLSTALHLLRDQQRSVQEVAELVGFSEPSAFSRAFRNWHGTPPHSVR